MTERKISITLSINGAVNVLFTGEHISKREMDRVLKALHQQYKQTIRDFRLRKANYGTGTGQSNSGTVGSKSSGTEVARAGVKLGVAETAKPAVARQTSN